MQDVSRCPGRSVEGAIPDVTAKIKQSRSRARSRGTYAAALRPIVATVAAVLLSFAIPLEAYQSSLDAKAIHEAFVLGQRNDQSTGAFLAPYIKEMTEGQNTVRVAEIEILTPFAQVVDDSRQHTSGYTEEQAAQKYHQTGNTVLVNVTLMLPAAYPQPASGTANRARNEAGSATESGTGTVPKGPAAPGAAAPDAQGAAATGQPPSAARPGDATKSPAAPPQSNSDLRPENFWQSFQFSFKQNEKKIPSKSIHDKPIYSTATKTTPSVLDGANVWIEFDAKDVAAQETVIEVVTPDSKTISATFDLKKLR